MKEMKILHLCLANYFVDGYNYQENALSRQNVADGHDVMIIASSKTLKNGTQVHYEEKKSYINNDGVKVKRIAFSKMPFSKKLNKQDIIDFNPDIIFFHGINSLDLRRVIKYIKYNPNVKLYVDNHTWFGQAGYKTKVGKLARVIFHKFFFKPIFKKNKKYIHKIFNISIECQVYLEEVYGIPSTDVKSEFYPLGGDIVESDKKIIFRNEKRSNLQISSDKIVYLHTGRLTKYKKTIELVTQFNKYDRGDSVLIIAGVISDEIYEDVMAIINSNEKILYVGWQDTNSLLRLMCASDLYIQPGNQSASLQNALCCGCPIIIPPHKSYMPFFNNNGYLIEDLNDLISIFNQVSKKKRILSRMELNSYKIAKEYLDYRILAKRMYE
jgi:hypothetical protein